MNGQLSEQPLAELIREISAKSLGGRLRLERERVQVVVYFENGGILFAASNLKVLRLREYLQKTNLVPAERLEGPDAGMPDAELIKNLSAQKLLSAGATQQIQTRQVTDMLQLALSWTDGVWDFDPRSRLNEQMNLKIDTAALLLEAGRRMPRKFAASRLSNPNELIAPTELSTTHANLSPPEGYLLSRLDRPIMLQELVAVSGIGEEEALALIYSLSLAGLLKREHWVTAFGGSERTTPPPAPEPAKPTVPSEEVEDDSKDLEIFLERVNSAQSHYEVLGVAGDAPDDQSLKSTYYQLAKRYHPDRFRRAEASVLTRIESAFARITQAYDTLRDDALRAAYDAKLENRKKAELLTGAAPKPAHAETPAEGVPETIKSAAERAETQFKEGFAAFEMGQRQLALGLFASAANAVPTEARYRAFYGHLLATDERTRRIAETELQAAIKLDPGKAEYRVMLAELYRDIGLKLRAKGEAERALAIDPNNKKAHELLRTLK